MRKPWHKEAEHRRLTGRPWRRVVERIKVRDRFTCYLCSRITIEGDVDHKVPLSKGGTDEDDNLGWICREPCHREKTARDAGATPRAPIGEDGWPRG
jgi:5-methylcytosine-specific restriction endonuclease McrA